MTSEFSSCWNHPDGRFPVPAGVFHCVTQGLLASLGSAPTLLGSFHFQYPRPEDIPTCSRCGGQCAVGTRESGGEKGLTEDSAVLGGSLGVRAQKFQNKLQAVYLWALLLVVIYFSSVLGGKELGLKGLSTRRRIGSANRFCQPLSQLASQRSLACMAGVQETWLQNGGWNAQAPGTEALPPPTVPASSPLRGDPFPRSKGRGRRKSSGEE